MSKRQDKNRFAPSRKLPEDLFPREPKRPGEKRGAVLATDHGSIYQCFEYVPPSKTRWAGDALAVKIPHEELYRKRRSFLGQPFLVRLSWIMDKDRFFRDSLRGEFQKAFGKPLDLKLVYSDQKHRIEPARPEQYSEQEQSLIQQKIDERVLRSLGVVTKVNRALYDHVANAIPANVPARFESTLSHGHGPIDLYSHVGKSMYFQCRREKRPQMLEDLKKVIDINITAYENGVTLDGHLDNFTKKYNRVFFIDFEPQSVHDGRDPKLLGDSLNNVLTDAFFLSGKDQTFVRKVKEYANERVRSLKGAEKIKKELKQTKLHLFSE